MAEDNSQSPQADRVGHAPTEISPGPILKSLLALVIVIIGTILVLLPWEHQEAPKPVATPEPRLLAHPVADLEDDRSSRLRGLDSYGWVDRDAGIAHIPVDRAIEILSRRAQETAPPAAAASSPAGSPP